MTIEKLYRLRGAAVLALEVAPASDYVAARLVLSLIEDELLAAGWTNSPAEVPAMDAGVAWAKEQIA